MISRILCGIIFVVVGNYMTKAKRNTVVGFERPGVCIMIIHGEKVTVLEPSVLLLQEY